MENLANLLRPKYLDDVIGQKNIIKLLKEAKKNNFLTSYLFFGEPGIGKTSCAIALANEFNYSYSLFNAAVDSKSDLIEKLHDNKIVIIDEIHRLNKDKQDILLSYLEHDKNYIFATTTENPYFKVNPALRSRLKILEFKKLDLEDIKKGILKHFENKVFTFKISNENLNSLIDSSSGDYRNILNNLQFIQNIYPNQEITQELIKTIIPNINFFSDKNSTSHYNNLSAFHKSLRGSDVDASLYYASLILKTGDIDGLIRRIIAMSYEDIGLASPNTQIRVDCAIRAIERLGMPEAKIPLGFIICELCLAPKSNSSYKSINNAYNYVENGKIYDTPIHLKDAHYKSANKLGYGIDYKYPHDFPYNYVEQSYLPNELKSVKFFEFGNSKNEQNYKQYWDNIKRLIKEKKWN
ncbi:replication-associated recombination protein A [Mycoplasma elephantis]|uniref:replication-associated recombination protein A n=1 Tax=Mycoplasma elephantis TaxID=114882 RepID=UPI000482053F|nr:replication-associated recombination protein A [Mycoplasma elephantis]